MNVSFFHASKILNVDHFIEKEPNYKGIYRTSAVKESWEAKIKVNGVLINGGCFSKQKDAAKRANTICRKFGKKRINPGLRMEDREKIPKRFRVKVMFFFNQSTSLQSPFPFSDFLAKRRGNGICRQFVC